MATAACPNAVCTAPAPRRSLSEVLHGTIARLVAVTHRAEDPEIARFFARSGGRITDSMEREVMQSVLERSSRLLR